MKDEPTRRRKHKSLSSSQIQNRYSREKSYSDTAGARRKDRKKNIDRMKTNNSKQSYNVKSEESSSSELSHGEMSSYERSQSRERRVSSGSSSSSTSEHASHIYVENSTEQLLLREASKFVGNHTLEGNKFAMSESENIIPEFDPMVKGQTINMWLNKVDECARFYELSEDQIIHYAMHKLRGVAKSWYETQPSILFSWPEWKVKLINVFSIDYAELLSEMLSKKAQHYESLQFYYYEKIGLLNACEIKGKNAVDCLLHGIEDYNLRVAAEAARFRKPEQVLKYFQSIDACYSVTRI